MNDALSTKPLWTPSIGVILTSQMTEFRYFVNQQYSQNLEDYADLHRWSTTCPDAFWSALWKHQNITANQPAHTIYQPGKRMQDTRWFVGAELNFAENLLRYRDEKDAFIVLSQSGFEKKLSYQQLYDQVAQLAAWLRKEKVTRGDRIVGLLPNGSEAVVAMLASTSIGAIWSACSPDFGLTGLKDRFHQIKPKILIAAQTHGYRDKTFNHLEKMSALQTQLPSLEKIVIVPEPDSKPTLKNINIPVYLWQDCLLDSSTPLEFTPLPFDHPLYILYSSGTTGQPKCMVHGAGGTLLQHLKELCLHTDLRRKDTIFFHTTVAWMMWHWVISSLAVGATIVLYDGDPLYPANTLFDHIDQYGITVFGVGAKLIEQFETLKLCPIKSHSLKTLRTVLTTGSPLLPKSFDFVYQKIKQNVCLSSISGGSDIISCFALGNPTLPVYRGELQCLGLGMDVAIFNEQGQAVSEEKGELVCRKPFPAMPIYFWNDQSGEKYQNAYFNQFPNVWTHGDYAQLTSHHGLMIYGRSDATLNPGGIRIGTAEIYQQVEKYPQIIDCLAVPKKINDDEQIILFVRLENEQKLTDELILDIKSTIKKNISPHHVPYKIIQAPDFPRTLNGKLMEIAVKKIINHDKYQQVETLANPESLDFFRQFEQDVV